MNKRAKISVHGIVQGVGFRPFIYRLANARQLAGWVCNTSGSVEIEAEGDERAISDFLTAIRTQAPPRARIDDIRAVFVPVEEHAGFTIRESLSRENTYQLISPDIATCDDCQREIISLTDRRSGYPFTNCTNCGPRFTIIKDIPYDRVKTTMSAFDMCSSCQREYDDPLNRRFHAQPNACSDCGPALWVTDSNGTGIECDDPLEKSSELLDEGKILAVKGLGGFHLVCDATNKKAVALLRERKHRRSKPLAVMIGTLEKIRGHCHVSDAEAALLASAAAPIVLLRWRIDSSDVTNLVAPKQKYLGVMLPYTPLHHILLRAVNKPLVMTSGNLSGEPLVKDNEEAVARLAGIADAFVLHNRGIHVRCDDSVCLVDDGLTRVVRRARGYAPDPITLPFDSRSVIACGSELKNTVCLTTGRHAFLSHHIGNMGSEEALSHLIDTINHYKNLFRIDPQLVACDMHPEYVASKYAHRMAADRGLDCVEVQHHHAHVVSAMIDNNLEGTVIGVAFDGTGYGSDGAIWGGEFLVADWARSERVGHLEYVPLPGGEAAIRRPYRMALSYLFSLLGEDVDLERLPFADIDTVEREVIARQVKRMINSPLTSSAGRLFDAVAAIAGVRNTVDYDGQAAIELEAVAADKRAVSGVYPFSVDGAKEPSIVRLRGMLEAILHDVRDGVPAATISVRFHRTMAAIIASVCGAIAARRNLDRVVLTGGVMQNRLLLHLATDALEQEGLRVFSHKDVPANDGGISLGQAVVAHLASGE